MLEAGIRARPGPGPVSWIGFQEFEHLGRITPAQLHLPFPVEVEGVHSGSPLLETQAVLGITPGCLTIISLNSR